MELPANWNRASSDGFPGQARRNRDSSLDRPRVLVPLGISFLMFSTAGALLAPFGTRWGFWPFPAAVDILRWSVIGACASTALLALSLVLGRRRPVLALLGVLLGLAVAGMPLIWQHRLREYPPIHDISTDMKNVPRFVLIAPLRRRCPNGVGYSGRKAAEAQARAYPDIKPLRLPPAEAFQRAVTAAREMGWMVVDASPSSLRIEATASTFWFGFKDDVVVCIARSKRGSRIDVRSASRVGSGDGGTNAARVRSFLKKVALP